MDAHGKFGEHKRSARSAQQDYGCTLALVNPIAQVSWLCYNYSYSPRVIVFE